MSSFLSKTKSLDLYAFSPSLTFGKEGKVYSRLGFLLTLITILIIGSMTIFLSIQVFQRKKPSILQYQVPSSQSRISFNTDTLPFAFTTTDWIRNPEAFVVSGKLSSPDYKLDLSVETCHEDHYCFSQPQGTESQTYLEKGGRSFLQIDFNKCQSDDSGTPKNCFSAGDLKTFLNNNAYTLMYDDWIIDPTDHEQPMKYTKTLFSDAFTADTKKVLLITLEEIEFISDDGLLFEDIKTETHLRASLSTQLVGSSASDLTVFSAKIQYNANKTIYKRTYPKVQDLLAQIAGFITIIIPIFFIFVFPYVNMKASQDFVNEICEVQLNRKQENLNRRIAKSKTKTPSKSLKYRAQTTTHGNLTTINLETKADVPLRGKRSQLKTLKTMKTEPDVQPKTTTIELNQSLQIRAFENLKDNNLDSFEILEENILTPRPPESVLKIPSCPFKASILLSPKSVESRAEDIEETHDGMMTSKRLLGGGVAEKLISMMKEKDEQEEVEGRQEIVIKIDSEEPEDKKEKENEKEESEESEVENIKVPLRFSDKIEVSWSDWLKSFFKSQPKVQIIKQAKGQILKTLDLVTLAKKVIEIDKLKACLLTHDQRVIFENLPSSVIAYDSDIKTKDAIRQYHWKESFKGDEKALKEAYLRITGAKTQRKLDKRLIKLYESEDLEDHVDAMVRTRKN